MPYRPAAGLIALAFIWLCLAAAISAASAQPTFPALTGRIVDEAGLLNPADTQELRRTLEEIELKSTDQVVIYTAKSLQGYPIEDFGYRLGRFWQIGQQGKNNGVILLVAPNERKVRIEVGRGLEPQLTDALSALIIQNAILPAFRRGDFPAGIKAGIRDIRDVLLGDAEAVKERARTTQTRDAPTGEDVATLIIIATTAVRSSSPAAGAEAAAGAVEAAAGAAEAAISAAAAHREAGERPNQSLREDHGSRKRDGSEENRRRHRRGGTQHGR
jgi:uncharacterized protein